VGRNRHHFDAEPIPKIRGVPHPAAELRGTLERGRAIRRAWHMVFAHPETGKPTDRSKLLKRFKAALRRADVRAVRFHEYADVGTTRISIASCGFFIRPASRSRVETNPRRTTGASGQNRGEKPWPPVGRTGTAGADVDVDETNPSAERQLTPAEQVLVASAGPPAPPEPSPATPPEPQRADPETPDTAAERERAHREIFGIDQTHAPPPMTPRCSVPFPTGPGPAGWRGRSLSTPLRSARSRGLGARHS
jgi:hypothetical protein